MRLSTNELRNRAAAFAQSHANATYEKGETQTFYNEFFSIFGVERRQVARYEEHVKKLNNKSGFIDLFWPRVLLIEQKGAGRDLEKATEQAGDYFDALKDLEKPRFQLVCDFQNFELLDRDTRAFDRFKLAELPNKIELFNFISGREQRVFKDQDPVNIQASELMGTIHDELESSGYKGHDLERFLVRLVFMLFADDTGIFEPRDVLLDLIENRTRDDGSDTGLWLAQLFEVLNTPEDSRNKNLDEDLDKFPYVNGDLFAENLRIVPFTAQLRETLLEACRFNWAKVSPAIFGSLFQSVMNKVERRKKGAHYTTEKNILKVIGPLFLDDLKAEFARLKDLKRGRTQGLESFRQGLGKLTFLDPACGCGNFLIIAYRELRELELSVLRELNPLGQRDIGVEQISALDVDQFYGIEFEEFPARIAEVAMWMMDHIMNNKLSLEFGQTFIRIPLKKSPHIKHANALRFDWNELLPAASCSYLLGNPPFIGKHLRSSEQEADMELIFGKKGGAGTLDYVSAWFLTAAKYIQNTNVNCAFVSTNSISQGEQVYILWNQILNRWKIKLHFAHRTFEWGSDAKGKAHVHCIIIGFGLHDKSTLRLFDYDKVNSEPHETQVKHLSPYLIDFPNLLIQPRSKPLTDVKPILYGSKPVDDGHLLLDNNEKNELIKSDPNIAGFIRPMLSAIEYINGKFRWCLWLTGKSPAELKKFPSIVERIGKVRNFRLASSKPATRRAAERPHEFAEIRQPKSSMIIVPLHSSETRAYIPFGFEGADYVVHNSCTCVPDGSLSLFGLMLSSMHMTWMRYTAGRIKSDYRYANTLVYNTFPWPELTSSNEAKIAELAQTVLDARSEDKKSR